MSITGIFLFIIILLVLVFIHELGHFAAAKWLGMRVDEFAFGFPPHLFSIKKGETTYSFNMLPFGGYVSIFGENGDQNDIAKKDPRAFGNRPWWAQVVVLVAGVTMNMLLAWILFIVISYGTISVSVDDPVYGARSTNHHLVVINAMPASPAYMAGIVPGSRIDRIDSGGVPASLLSATSVVDFIAAHQNSPIRIIYTNPEGIHATTTIAAVYGIVPDKKAVGLSFDVQGEYVTTLLQAVGIGSQQTYVATYETLQGLSSLIQSLVHGENVMSSLSGPIGIAKIVGTTSEFGYRALLGLTAVLSINLAILNILPLPALDGGRIIMVLGEKVARRKIPITWMMIVNGIGFICLALLIILVTIKDIFG